MPLQYRPVHLQGSACGVFFKHANLMAEQKAGMLGFCEVFFEITLSSGVVSFPFCIVTVKSHCLVGFQGKSGVKMGLLWLGVFH